MESQKSQGFLKRIRNTGGDSGQHHDGNGGKPPRRLGAKWAGGVVIMVGVLALCSLAYASGQAGNATQTTADNLIIAMPTAEAVNEAARDLYKSGPVLDAVPPASGEAGSDPSFNQYSTGSTTKPAQTQPWDRKIIRTATLQLTVKDVVDSVDKVRLLAALHGGYVFQSDSHQEGEYTLATITIQVPTQEFDKVMPELRKLDGQVKKITSENVNSNDVTEEYVDLQSQLRNLQSTEARMLALQVKAERLEDILSLDQQIRSIQGDIERIQGRLNFLGNRSDLSSITVSLTPDMAVIEPEPTPVSANSWNPVEVARKAWEASLDMLSGVATIIITGTVFMWWAIPLLLIALVVALRLRRRPGGDTPSAPTPPAGPATSTGEAGA